MKKHILAVVALFALSAQVSKAEAVGEYSERAQEKAMETCRSFSYASEREDCFAMLLGAQFQAKPMETCMSFSKRIERRDCMAQIANKRYVKTSLELCGSFSRRLERASCLDVLGNLTYSADSRNLCRSRRTRLDRMNCYARTGTLIPGAGAGRAEAARQVELAIRKIDEGETDAARETLQQLLRHLRNW